MSGHRLSVVIPTFNRRERLRRVLDALNEQTVAAGTFDVIVVDDGSSDGTGEWLGNQRYRYGLHAYHQTNAGPATARNTGVLKATGALVLFLDDDVVPAPDLVLEHLRSHDSEPGELAVIGPLASLSHYDDPWVAWEQDKVERQYAAMSRGDFVPTFRQFWTGNASVSRHEVIAAGLFDVDYLRGEDVELGIRLDQRGVKFRFNARARGLHHAERSLASWANAHSSYGRLEVRMLSRLGEDTVLDVLAGNFSRLKPSVRWLVQHCIDSPGRHAGATAALSAFLRSPASGARALSLPACSVLANLLYWRASSEALGPERFSKMVRQSSYQAAR
jgi:glycosyltransferase involved in cell wall biosynthesis